MKRLLKLIGIVFVCIFTLSSCDLGGSGGNLQDPNTQGKVIELESLESEITIKDYQVENYDYTSLFKLKVDGKLIKDVSKYINSSTVQEEVGSYFVFFTISDKMATVVVNVVAAKYEIILDKSEITINAELIDSYDFKSLFHVLRDDETLEVTDDMITNGVKKAAGTYDYTLHLGSVSKTLKVNVIVDADLEIYPSYNIVEIEYDKLDTFDYSTLFNVYESGKYVTFDKDAIDKSALKDAEVGSSYPVSLTYSTEKGAVTKSVMVRIVEAQEVTVKAKNIVTYPNSKYIDLKTLFEVKKGDEIIQITDDLIQGYIDYSKASLNVITLNFEGKIYQATVEIRNGVVLEYKTTEVITILKGTNQATYAFTKDFVVRINGIIFDSIPLDYLDVSGVDFNKTGDYPVTIRIPYNEKIFGLTSVNFDFYTLTVIYHVVTQNYTVDVEKAEVILPKGTTSYNVFDNLAVTVNGRKQALTDNSQYVDPITTYALVISNPLDYTSKASQEVVIDVYAQSLTEDPVRVSFTVLIESDIVVEAKDQVIFAYENLKRTDPFKLYIDGIEKIDLEEYITGYFNPNRAGLYTLEIAYEGIVKKANITVLNETLKGTYATKLVTIASDSTVDDEGFEDSGTKSSTLKDLVINSIQDMKLNNRKVELIEAVSENTLLVQIGYNTFTLTIENGILFLNPDNSHKLPFSDYSRPMIYFNKEIWTIDKKVTINYGSSYVLGNSVMTYSLDTFFLTNNITKETKTIGLYVELVDRTSADTIYDVKVVDVKFDNDTIFEATNATNVTFGNTSTKIVFTSSSVAQVSKEEPPKKYSNMIFNGTIDGESAKLMVTQYEGFQLQVGGKTVFNVGGYELNNMRNKTIDYDTDTLILYGFRDDYFSYKIHLNLDNKTFTIDEKDTFFGLYETSNGYIFLDGYGGGVINYDKKSYYETCFDYEIDGYIVTINYKNTKSTFAYGTYAKFVMDSFLNKLTTIETKNNDYIDKDFICSKITKGALVTISDYRVGADTDKIARTALLSQIRIETKDGVLNADEKKALVDTSKIKFNTPGFYQLTITIDIGNEKVTNYYAVQVMRAIYENNPLVGLYGSGVLNENYTLNINKYGQIFLDIAGANTTYQGNVTILEDNTFTGTLQSDTLALASVSGYMIEDGLIFLRCSGSLSLADYFTIGTNKVIGTNQNVLRQITLKNSTVYIYSPTTTNPGELALVEILEGSSINQKGTILKITTDTKVVYAKILEWDNARTGLELSDYFRGSYKSSDDILTLDGFGKATYNGVTGTYELVDNYAQVMIDSVFKVFKINRNTETFEEMNIVFDDLLLKGLTFSASYTFFCDQAPYKANTSFTFLGNKKILVTSTSSDHDASVDGCDYDKYSPSFASSKGIEGTYTISNNILTISVGGALFTFKMHITTNVTRIICTSTTLSSSAHGYFSVGQSFDK